MKDKHFVKWDFIEKQLEFRIKGTTWDKEDSFGKFKKVSIIMNTSQTYYADRRADWNFSLEEDSFEKYHICCAFGRIEVTSTKN